MTESRFGEVIERLAREGRSLTEIVEQLRKERRWANVDERTVSHYARQHGIEIQGIDVTLVPSAGNGEQNPESEFGQQEATALVLRPKEAPVWRPPPPIPAPSREWKERWGKELVRFFEENQAKYGWRDFWDMVTSMFQLMKNFPKIREAFLAVLDESIELEEKVRELEGRIRERERACLEHRAAERLRELDAEYGDNLQQRHHLEGGQ